MQATLFTVCATYLFFSGIIWTPLFGTAYKVDDYLSPLFSPLIKPDWLPTWISPGLFILWVPLGFRATCYYYRKAYYRFYFADPPGCAVGEPTIHRRYKMETAFPFILQNIHRYFFYLATIILGFLGFTLMPLGTAFLFPCVTGLLSRVVPGNERGLYMGVQHTFGGVSRVLFPVAAGLLMDRFGVGVPFWISGLLVLATLPFAWALAESLPPESPATAAVRVVSSADVTGEFLVEKVAEERGAGDSNPANSDI